MKVVKPMVAASKFFGSGAKNFLGLIESVVREAEVEVEERVGKGGPKGSPL